MNICMHTAVCSTALLIAASGASAQTASIAITNAGPAGGLGNAGNSTQTGSFTETFTARSLSWSGTLTSAPNAFFFEEDVFASIQGPNGIGYTGPIAGEQGIVLGATPFSGWTSAFAPASIEGDWSFEAFTPNTFPDSTNWSISSAEFGFNQALFPDATSIGIGSTRVDNIVEGEILWYSVDHAGGAIEFSTAGSSIFELDGVIQTDDTLIALFDSSGLLVDFNDDGSDDFTSLLSFADLVAGDYRLAVTGSTLGTRVGQQFISTSHDGVGSINLTVAVPAPMSTLPLATASIFACRRHRHATSSPSHRS